MQDLYAITLAAAQILAREPSAALSSWHLPCAPTNFAKQRLCAARWRRMVAASRGAVSAAARGVLRRLNHAPRNPFTYHSSADHHEAANKKNI